LIRRELVLDIIIQYIPYFMSCISIFNFNNAPWPYYHILFSAFLFNYKFCAITSCRLSIYNRSCTVSILNNNCNIKT
jgi:hypothetical protein